MTSDNTTNNAYWHELLLKTYYSESKSVIYYVISNAGKSEKTENKLNTETDKYEKSKLQIALDSIRNGIISERVISEYYDDETYEDEFLNINNFMQQVKTSFDETFEKPILDNVYKYVMSTNFLKHDVLGNVVPENNLSYFSSENIITYLESSNLIHLAIKSGVDIDFNSSGFESPLINAIQMRSIDKVKILLDYRANPNQFFIEDNSSQSAWSEWTPLYLAICVRNTEIIKLLLEHGANPNLRINTKHRNTPLQYAIKLNSPEIVTLLLEHGADLNLKLRTATYNRMITPLRYAIELNYQNLVNLLLNWYSKL